LVWILQITVLRLSGPAKTATLGSFLKGCIDIGSRLIYAVSRDVPFVLQIDHSFDRVLPVLFAEPLGGRPVQGCFSAEADHIPPSLAV